MIGILGDIPFLVSFDGKNIEALNFEGLNRSGGANYEEHKRRGLKPALEFIGIELDTVSLDINLRSDLGVNPREMVDKIEDYKDTGKVLDFIIGSKPFGSGKYVIESYGAGHEYITNRGRVRKIVVNLNLKEHVEDLGSNIEIVKTTKKQTTKKIVHEDFNQGAIER